MVTFDGDFPITAAKSSEWIAVKPGTDGAIAMAMCHVVMENKLYDEEFLTYCKATENPNATLEEKIAGLKSHFAQYTPQWAAKISGVDASKIESLALEFAKTKPAVVISYRGAVAHYNGNDTERSIQTLAALTRNIDLILGVDIRE